VWYNLFLVKGMVKCIPVFYYLLLLLFYYCRNATNLTAEKKHKNCTPVLVKTVEIGY